MVPLFMGFSMPEMVLIVLVILLLFGGKKIPELMRGIGKGVKSFKDGVNSIEEDIKQDGSSEKKDANNEETVEKDK